MKHSAKAGARAHCTITTHAHPYMSARPHSRYLVECRDRAGNLKWQDDVPNLVVNAGLDHMLSVITATAHVTNWFVGITTSGFSIAATDTATTAGFTRSTAFSEAVLQTYSAGAIAAQSVSNATGVAAFSMNAATTIGGAYMVNSNGKAAATTGAILFGGAAFSAERTVASGDTLNVTVTVSTEVT